MLADIFKAYDVRGIYGQNLTEDVCCRIGRAFVHFLKCRDVIVGIDMRVSSPKLSRAFMKGVAQQGANAIFIGKVCTDAAYFASGFLQKPAVMFTASHNPSGYNGIKFCKRGAVPINNDTGLSQIKSYVNNSEFEKYRIRKKGKVVAKDVLNAYVKHVRKFIDVEKIRRLKIAVDAGNGMAGKIIPLVYKNIKVRIIPLFFKLDGNFPNHPADPSKSENLVELQKSVLKNKCDFGIGFDGDADRIFFVDENGKAVNSSLISALIIKNLLLKRKSEKIIYNLVCSHIVPEIIKKYGGIPIIERVGHSFIKETMRKTKAMFACEHSAHYYYRDNYRADSGIVTSLIAAELVSKQDKPLSGLLKEFRKYYTMEETSFEAADKNAKISEIEEIYRHKSPKTIYKLDGITIEFENWWFNLRPSNTEPLLRLNLEADDQAIMEDKKKEVISLIAQ